ncbi:MAG: hypothetical protein JSS34_08545 [Proteobacteria bacterium]|nr:hypothetical protein [Pseudomonadota bacterium]
MLFKNRTLKNFIFLLFSFVFTSAQGTLFEGLDKHSHVIATFYHVGQGHSTLIHVPDGPAILVDSGSTEHTGVDPTVRQQEIADDIIHHISIPPKSAPPSVEKPSSAPPASAPATNPEKPSSSLPASTLPTSAERHYNLIIIITHADKDHVGWLREILRRLKTNSSVRPIYLFGGSKEDYQTEGDTPKLTDAEILEFRRANIERLGEEKLFAQDYGFMPSAVSFNIPAEAPWGLKVFAMNSSIPEDTTVLSTGSEEASASANSKKTDPNLSSIVLRFHYQNKSIMIAGDAPQFVTDQIRKKLYLQKLTPSVVLKSDILLLSHHGAKTDGTNDLGWIENINPSYAVISAGQHIGYKHPAAPIVSKLAAFIWAQDRPLTEHHEIGTFGMLDSDIPSGIAKIKSKTLLKPSKPKTEEKEVLYATYETTLPIFTTLQSGNVGFAWDVSSPDSDINVRTETKLLEDA